VPLSYEATDKPRAKRSRMYRSMIEVQTEIAASECCHPDNADMNEGQQVYRKGQQVESGRGYRVLAT
jgi:hypothetical protein